MTAVVRSIVGGGQTFFCPGCQHTHSVNTAPNGPRWTYNGDPVRPTFGPSILVTAHWSASNPTEKDDVCHSFVRAGRIEFLGDCTHVLAGQTVDLPPWPYAPGSYGGIEESADGQA